MNTKILPQQQMESNIDLRPHILSLELSTKFPSLN